MLTYISILFAAGIFTRSFILRVVRYPVLKSSFYCKGIFITVLCHVVFSLFIFSCTFLDVDDVFLEPDFRDRRMYVNDAAANDSLNRAIYNGVTFYAQPGGSYSIVTHGAGEGPYSLYLYNIGPHSYNKLPPVITGRDTTLNGLPASVFNFLPDVDQVRWL